MQMNVQIYFIGYSVLFGLLVPFLNVHNVALYSKLIAHREVGLENIIKILYEHFRDFITEYTIYAIRSPLYWLH